MSEATRPTIELTFACPAPGCGAPVVGPLTPETSSLSCPTCSTATTLPEAAEALAAEPFAPCPVCGSNDLFTQRDFNRRLGLLLAGHLAEGPLHVLVLPLAGRGTLGIYTAPLEMEVVLVPVEHQFDGQVCTPQISEADVEQLARAIVGT